VNAQPKAAVLPDRVVGVHQPLELDASQSTDPDGVIADATWDLGDGRTAGGVEALASWADPGAYTVQLRVADESGARNGTDTSSFRVTVVAPPEISVDAPSAVCEGEPVTMTAAVAPTTGMSERPVELQWSFPDGEVATGSSVTRSFDRAGEMEITVVADDGLGLTTSRGEVVHWMTVNRPPSAAPGAPQVVCPGDPVELDGGGSSDPDGDSLRFSWATGEGRSLAGDAPSWEMPGSRSLVLTVDDQVGTSCSTATAELPVRVNARPVARAGEDLTAWTGGALDVAVLDGRESYDPDGDQLTYIWDLGDGTTAAGPVVQHAYAKPGVYTVQLTVSDGSGLLCGAASDEVVVTVEARR
jgi:PKD repeat protein